jgi:tetratricopeptide (TPR) repeat protein
MKFIILFLSVIIFSGCATKVSVKAPSEGLQEIENAFLNEKWDDVITVGENRLKAEPENPVIHFLLSMAYYMKGDYDRQENHRALATDEEKNMETVISWCEQFTERFPKNYYVRLLLGSAYRAKEDVNKAMDTYKKAIEINPFVADGYVGLATTYFATENIGEAIKYLKKAIELNPEHIPAYYNLGFMYEFNGQNNEAIASYKKTIELKPDFKEVYINLGDLYLEMGEKDNAIKVYQSLIDMDPDGDLSRYAKDVIERIKEGNESE